ncbi:HGxxPAAW family protein [Lapillicoccus jejuensis]|uniref:Uncharacterized protein n=1 Tax=Lapillicoccus jejuensis TaxID=402171 RepID=A0A542E3Z5_9MICO|nr:HGxxPAAW family protein [Lapillicoccus jejuensis]TQJ10068.1 hypothetical protein FB458_3186 [Lapillicoccus jejuensis]
MSETAHESHGHSTAAWTSVGVILLGGLISSLALIFPSAFFFWVGVAVMVVGAALGKILSMAGYGDKASSHAARAAGHAEPGQNRHDSGTA